MSTEYRGRSLTKRLIAVPVYGEIYLLTYGRDDAYQEFDLTPVVTRSHRAPVGL